MIQWTEIQTSYAGKLGLNSLRHMVPRAWHRTELRAGSEHQGLRPKSKAKNKKVRLQKTLIWLLFKPMISLENIWLACLEKLVFSLKHGLLSFSILTSF